MMDWVDFWIGFAVGVMVMVFIKIADVGLESRVLHHMKAAAADVK